MRNLTAFFAAAIGAILAAAAASVPGVAQPFERQGLLDRANNSYAVGRCLDSAMNYYALLQQFSATLSPQVKSQMRGRIDQCRRVGTAGIEGKADSPRPPGWSSVDTTPITAPAPASPGPAGRMVVLTPMAAQLSDASASPRERSCRTYAETAVAQTQALAASACGRRSGYARVSPYQFHYDWCTQRGTPAEARAFANQRAQALNSCTLIW